MFEGKCMKVNFFTAQIKLWGRIFDYKGKSTKKEYWFAFLFHAILGLLACACIALSAAALIFTGFRYDWHIQDLAKIVHYVFLIPGIILTAYLAIAVIPWISLTVRRLRDGGKSAWWALLLLIVGVGHILLFVICVSASGIAGIFNPSRNVPEGIYEQYKRKRIRTARMVRPFVQYKRRRIRSPALRYR